MKLTVNAYGAYEDADDPDDSKLLYTAILDNDGEEVRIDLEASGDEAARTLAVAAVDRDWSAAVIEQLLHAYWMGGTDHPVGI